MLIQPCEKCGHESPQLRPLMTNEGYTLQVCPTCAMYIVNERQTNESQLLKG